MQIISTPANVKRIQRGAATLTSSASQSVTLLAVDLSKVSVSVRGAAYATMDIHSSTVLGRMTSATNLSIERGGSTGTMVVYYEVIEYA